MMFRRVLLLLWFPFTIYAACPSIITRADWNAKPPLEKKPLAIHPAPYVVVHHSAGALCTTLESCKTVVKSIQRYHMDELEWEDIGYNFLIGGDGSVLEGRGWNTHGAHLVPYNRRSIGICLLGNFMVDGPTKEQLTSLQNLIDCGVSINEVVKEYHLIGHRQGGATLCPGDKLYSEIEKWPHFMKDPK